MESLKRNMKSLIMALVVSYVSKNIIALQSTHACSWKLAMPKILLIPLDEFEARLA